MQQHVEQGELHLAQRLHAALEVARRQHAVIQLARQRLAGVHVRRHVAQNVPFPAEVFHELAGQFHGVPLHAADAGHIVLVHLRQHVVQAVAGLVEQGDDVVVREQRGLAADTFGEVADQVCHRRLQAAVIGAHPTRTHIIHPGATALALAGGRIQVELADQHAIALQPVELHAVVPDGSVVAPDAHIEQALDNLEQAGQHLGRREVLLHFLLAEGVARFLEFFADIGPVPGLRIGHAQLCCGKFTQVGHVFLGVRTGLDGQVAQKADDFIRAVCHLGHQRHLGKGAIAQQCRFFLTQGQDLCHHGAVVELDCVAVRLVGSAGVVGTVERLAQGAAVRKLHHRQVAGDLQCELVAVLAIRLCGGTGCIDHILRDAFEFVERGVVGPAVCGIQRVLAELLRQLGHAFLDGGVAFTVCALQLGTAQHESAQCVFQGLLLLGIQAGGVNGFVFGIEALIGAQARPEVGHGRQHGVVGGAQLGRFVDALEVADGTPGTAQLFGGNVQRACESLPLGRKLRRRHRVQSRISLGQQLRDGRSHMFRLDLVEQRQGAEIEQGVGRGDGGGRSRCSHPANVRLNAGPSRVAAKSPCAGQGVALAGATPTSV